MIKLLITDLDDTLYSWIRFFIPAFYSMVDELIPFVNKSKNEILQEYKVIHQQMGSVEFPHATLLLPSVKSAFSGCTKEQLTQILDPVFHKFNSVRKERLKLYPQVRETLQQLYDAGITIIGYTESAEENGFYRLKKLRIDNLFTRVYVSDSSYQRPNHISSSPKTRVVLSRKPNPDVLRDIVKSENMDIQQAIYVGDSLTKDIYMAKAANIVSILCKYPPDPLDNELYYKLVAISSWTDTEFQREADLKEKCKENNIKPDYVIRRFGALLDVISKIDNNDGRCSYD